MTRLIHIVQGFSAAGCFRQAMHPKRGDLLINDDVLSCGPLSAFESPEQWAKMRGAYWHSVEPDRSQAIARFNSEFLARIFALRDSDSVLVWLGVGVAEQLLLAWVVHLLKVSGSRAQVSVVQFTRAGKHNMDVWGLGLLNPDQIEHHPPIEALSFDAIAELERYWAAVTSADPTKLLSMLPDASTRLSHCQSSLRQMILRYPDHATGLGRWDFELLRYAKEKGPRVSWVIGHLMGNNLGADLVGDTYIFARLRRLGADDIAHPLVSLSGDSIGIRGCEAVLTDAGESVLAGRANAIELNGIDDWVLGVHLDSRQGTVWCRKDGALYKADRPAGHADGEPGA